MKKNLTKSESLELIQKKIKNSNIVPKFIYFTKKNYLLNKNYYLKKIKRLFKKRIIIRSSALNEDTNKTSNAGKYDSFIVDKISIKKVDQFIKKICKKYKKSKDQVLIQELIYKPDLSGVLFTKDKKTNSNYYEISYDSSKRTDLVTSGKYNDSLKLLIIRKSSKKVPNKFKKLVTITNKLENLFDNERLDIEFCIKNNQVFILQCRPLLGINNKINDKFLNDVVINLKKKFIKLQKITPNIFGNKTLLSNMSDWNPAEMIGTNPGKLALSLYSNLITNDIWSKQRVNYGYKDVRPNRLMIDMAGSPYIDLRVDLNSFLPKNLSKKISTKIVNNSIKYLKINSSLHDKIEFEIIDTCYNFNLNTKKYDFLSSNEKKKYFNELKILTNNILNPQKKFLENELDQLKILENKIEKIKLSNLSHIQKIFFLINDCKQMGTLPFAGIARCAFISTNILLSLKNKELLNENELNNFYKSLNTISKDINNNYYKSIKNKNYEFFIKKYGHLRPSMYSILTDNYKKNFKNYFPQNKINLKFHKKTFFKINQNKLQKLNKIFIKEKLVINFSKFIIFAKKSIEYRELAKLIFSKSINEIFENLIKFAKETNIDKNDLNNIDIDIIINAYNELNQIKLKKIVLQNINTNKTNHNFSKFIKMPDVIKDINDFDYFESINAKENYITNQTVTSNVLDFSKLKNYKNIANSLILIENADPGYDFLFSYNISGLITKYGGSNSHMAIRCMELNIPAIIGIGNKRYNEIINARKIFLDCKNNNYKVIL
jgi:phosphohistidine swiveling domain-containing protein